MDLPYYMWPFVCVAMLQSKKVCIPLSQQYFFLFCKITFRCEISVQRISLVKNSKIKPSSSLYDIITTIFNVQIWGVITGQISPHQGLASS